MNSSNRSITGAVRVPFLIAFLLLALTPVFADTTPWGDTARAWEEMARKFQEAGDASAAREAWSEAALAWERDGKARTSAAGGRADRVNELEDAIDATTAELAAWRRTAVAWRQAAAALRGGADEGAVLQASERASMALARIAELEQRLDELTARLAARRQTLIDMPISDDLQRELVERWSEVARSWELTAATWTRSGEPGKARIARMKAEEVRARIREIRPDLDEAWIRTHTYPPGVQPEAPASTGAPAAPPGPAVSTDAGPTAPPSEASTPVEPAPGVQVEIPELASAPNLPPDWLLLREEREELRNAAIWRQSAETWRTTAISRAAAGEWQAASVAVAKSREALNKATESERAVRTAYARREAEISTAVAKAFGEEPRTEEDILARLDAGPLLSAAPPTLAGDAVALAPPSIPGRDTAAQRRGFFDLEIGGPLPSTLTIRGRKVVDVNYSVTKYRNADANRTGGNSQSSFNLNQELQVEVLGRVGREDQDHINVNIRYDDTQRGVNSVNNRTIGVDFVGVPHKTSWGTYQYDFDFGDISVSFPGSEFALYNKSLFGARGELTITDLDLGWLKADRISLLLVGSQTKGVSASKEFTLNGERVPPEEFRDINFARDRYYLIEPDATQRPISQVQVYRDDGLGSNDVGTINFMASGVGTAAGFSHTGNWNLLVAGQDYILNQSTGELEMLSGVGANDLLAVTYSGQTVSYVSPARLIRVPSDSAVAKTAFRVHELRNRYKLSRQRVKKDDPNLVFRIVDALGNAQTTVNGVPTTYLRLFGFDRDQNDQVDVELIDYDFGVIRPIDTAPFARTGIATIDNNTLYTQDEFTDADHKYTIHIEYSSDQPQEIFTLGFDIIKNSDIVLVDGVRAERDVDYFIDYEAGIITFLNKAMIKPDSKIRVDYEYLPFGGQFERTLVGTRLDVNVNPKLRFGTTLLYDFSAAAEEVPNIFEDMPNQNAIVEIDANLQLGNMVFDFLDRDGSSERIQSWKQNFRLDLGGEWAWATHSPNTFGAAVIEDFESIEDIVAAGFGRTSWAPASAPVADTGVLLGSVSPASRGVVATTLRDNFGHRTSAQVEDEERQTSIQFTLNFAAGETWVAVRQPLSAGAINFTNMTAMEMYASGIPATMRVYVDAGVISEDADGDGILDSEDNGLDASIPGDAGENNGALNTGEDVGITFNHFNRGPITIGLGDGALTTEDMNTNFKLDQAEAFFRLGNLNGGVDVETKTFSGYSNSSWMLYRVPWRNRIPIGAANVTVIKQVRLIFVRQPGLDTDVTFYMDQLQFRGNRFTGSSSDSKIVLLPRNNENDPNYVSPARPELKGPASTKEQSLALKWSMGAGESSTVRQGYSKPIDLGDYRRLSFYMAGDARGETFSLILVSDENNYIEIRRRISTGTDLKGLQAPLWERVDVPLDPIRQATLANILGTGDTTVILTPGGYTIHIVGEPSQLRSPSLSNINQIWLRIASTNADSGEIWLNDIYAAEPIDQDGIAQKASFASGWGDLWTLSGSWRDVPGKYRGVGIINDPQTGRHVERSEVSRSLSATLALHRLIPLPTWLNFQLPLSATWSQNTSLVDPDNVENALQADLGKIVSDNQQYNATLSLWKLPSIAVSYGRTSAERDYRREDYNATNSNFLANTSYQFFFPRKLFGLIPTGRSLYLNTAYSFGDQRSKVVNSAQSGLSNISSRTANQNLSVGLNARPVDALNVSYDYNTAYLERNTLIASEHWAGITSRAHRTSAQLSLPQVFGIQPGLSFSGNYSEGFRRMTYGIKAKDINLGGNFSINVSVNPASWTRLLSFLSVRYSYTLSSLASYNNMNTGTSFTDVIGDYVGERLFPWGSSKRVGQGTNTGVTASRSSGSTNNVHSISGDIRTFSWLQTSYSASLSRNEVASLSTLSVSDGINAALNMRMDYNQAFPRSIIKFRSSYLTASVSYGRTENAASRTNSIAPSLNWNAQWTDALNMSFTMGYSRATSVSTLIASSKSVTEALNPSVNFTYYFDIKIPEAVSLPGVGQVASLNRRVQLSGGFNANLSRSAQGNKTTTEQTRYGMNLALGYRISNNLDLTASTTGSWLADKLEKQNDNFSLGGGARVEWRF